MIKNKRGVTFSAWIEVALVAVLFFGALAIVATNMNNLYGKHNDLTYGIVSNKTLTDLQDYQSSVINNTQQGQASITDFGILKLTTIPSMLNLGFNLVLSFITGGFIDNIVGAMNLGDYSLIVIIVFRTLYIIGLAFALIKLFTKTPV